LSGAKISVEPRELRVRPPCSAARSGACWRDPVALQDPPDRRGARAVAECDSSPPDPYVPSARVLPRHPHYQGGDDVVDRWPPGPAAERTVLEPVMGFSASTWNT
jgi:hypothetical protein